MRALGSTVTNYLLSASSSRLRSPSLHCPSAFFLKLQRHNWIWAPIDQHVPSNLPPPLPGLLLKHPDNLPPGERYGLSVRGPYTRKASPRLHGDVSITAAPPVSFPFSTSMNSRISHGQRCQLVWDAGTKSVSLFTPDEHPIPGSRRYLKDLLAVRPRPTSGQVLVEVLVKEGHISQEEADKIPKFHQTDYDLARLQEMGFSQRVRIQSTKKRSYSPRLGLNPRFQSPDCTLKLRDTSSRVPVTTLELDDSEKCLMGHDVRIIPHMITNDESGPRLGVHLVEVVGHPEPGFTTVNRPLTLQYRVRQFHFSNKIRMDPGASRPLNDRYFLHGKFFLDFVDMVDKHRQSASASISSSSVDVKDSRAWYAEAL